MRLRDPRVRRGHQRGQRLHREAIEELRSARRSAGLTQEAVARLLGVSQQTISRIELGELVPDIVTLATLAAVVGRDLAVRVYPGGPPVRDLAHSRQFDRLKLLLPGHFIWRSEVPLAIPGDQRAIDAMIVKPSIRTGFELESLLSAAEAVARRVALKQRDAGLEAMVLVLADTRANRAAVTAAHATLQAAFPTSARAVLADLRAGRSPQGNGILLV